MPRTKGSFQPGPDPRRRQWTRAECRYYGARGFSQTLALYPHLGLWLLIKIKQTCPREIEARRKGAKRARQRTAG